MQVCILPLTKCIIIQVYNVFYTRKMTLIKKLIEQYMIHIVLLIGHLTYNMTA